MTASDDPILAVVLKDCAAKLVIRYHFSRPVTRATVAALEARWPGVVELQEFSRFVPGSKDAFKLVGTAEALLVQGVLDDRQLRVTFGWLTTPKAADRALAERFDGYLVEAGFGDRVVRDARRAARS